MSNRRTYIILGLIFLIVLGARLYFAFQTPYFSDVRSYNVIRNVENIADHGIPLINDDLSFSGRETINLPLFSYFLSFFNIFMPVELVGKIIPNLLASLLVIIVFLIAKELTGNDISALFAALVSGFTPVWFKTVNSISPYSLAFPMMFLMILCILRMKQIKYVYAFLILLLLVSITNYAIILLLLGILIYLLLIKIENIKIENKEIELFLFSIFFFVLLQFIAFKNMFLFHGSSVIYQNIPTEILNYYYSDINVILLITQIGAIPFMYGMYALVKYVFSLKNKNIYLFIGFTLSTAFLLWLKLIELHLGLICLGIIMSILFSLFYKRSRDYLNKTRFDKYKRIMLVAFFLTLSLTSIIPSLYAAKTTAENAVSREEVNALIWLKKNSEENEVILGTFIEGHLISQIAKRKNVADMNFLMIEDIDEIYDDVKTVYTTQYETTAIKLLNKYNVKYILFSKYAKDYFEVIEPIFVKDERCFKKIYDDQKEVEIYESLCKI